MFDAPDQRSPVLSDAQFTTPWGLPETVAALLIALVAEVLGGTALLLVARGFPAHHRLEFLVLAYQFLAVGVAASAVWLILSRFNLGLVALGFRFPGWNKLLGAAAIVPAVFVAVGLLYLVFNTFLPGYHLQSNSNELSPGNGNHVNIVEKFMVLAWAAVEAPLVEETLFRGIVFQGLRHFFTRWLPYQGSVFAAATVSGLAFGLAHFEPHTLPILVFLGIVLAYVFQTTRSIYASTLVHGIVNGYAIVALFFVK